MGKIKTHGRNRNLVLVICWAILLFGLFTAQPSYIWSGFLLLNLYAFWLTGTDKRSAKAGSFRIPERSLMTVSALGGALGMLIGMKTYRHKTQHAKFQYGVPAFLIVQFVVAIAAYRYLG
ncbi:DUF1294 domain-containing protein [Brevibacillus fluminis]|uniref:DUF1294 domain-containing protein n=1 Tax=Brevibacillus fluminis TaxID=511487 RepID=A0A3M8DQC3_9BACL|nr:DUF1294 domain-containing protein [Brevibacillus fluminis]RNB90336.1 DUF1294 domain-containing protein [Brevibacillus fluminis]